MARLYRPNAHPNTAKAAAHQPAHTIHYLGRYRLLRLPRHQQTVEVLDGSAWVTMGGEDIILHAGDRLELKSGHDFALVSSVNKALLVLAETA
jgi:hypothetical protein